MTVRDMLIWWLVKYGTRWVRGDELETTGYTTRLYQSGCIEFMRIPDEIVVSWRITQKGMDYIKGDSDD